MLAIVGGPYLFHGSLNRAKWREKWVLHCVTAGDGTSESSCPQYITPGSQPSDSTLNLCGRFLDFTLRLKWGYWFTKCRYWDFLTSMIMWANHFFFSTLINFYSSPSRPSVSHCVCIFLSCFLIAFLWETLNNINSKWYCNNRLTQGFLMQRPTGYLAWTGQSRWV